MATTQVGVLMETEEFRDYIEPVPPRTPLRENNAFRVATCWVMGFAALWIIATILTNSIKPSKLTFIAFLTGLIFYAGEYIEWKVFNRKKRQLRNKQVPWKER